jgi:hypothetical protein
MTERDAIFRERLVALMTALNGGESRDPALRRAVGAFVYRLVKEAGARDWTDLKNRADAGSYDSMLQLFQRESQAFHKKGDTKSVRAVEALGISLIARYQQQGDLLPGVRFLDNYIEDCAATVKRANTRVLNIRPTAH